LGLSIKSREKHTAEPMQFGAVVANFSASASASYAVNPFGLEFLEKPFHTVLIVLKD
jgi:hypothetical protein